MSIKFKGRNCRSQRTMEFDETSNYLNVGIAINGNKSSKYVVQWALDKFIPEGNAIIKLIHVWSRILGVPMREDVSAAYTKEMEWKTNEMLLPYRRMCAKAQVEVDVVVIESEDVAEAISSVVVKSGIRKLVIGASSRGMFSRKAKSALSSKISEGAPSFCTVYSISKGRLSSVRASDTGSSGADDISASSSQTDRSSFASSANFSSASLTSQRFQALAMMNQNLFKSRRDSSDRKHYRFESLDLDERKDSMDSRASSRTSGFSDRASVLSDPATDTSSSDNQVNINFELEQLRIELRHAKGMYAMAQTESIDASRKLDNLNMRLEGESKKLEEVRSKEEEAREAVREEREKREKAKREARMTRLSVDREAGLRAEAEAKAAHDASERAKMEAALAGPAVRFREFGWEEIVGATSSFSEDLKVGMGGYGTVYRCTFHHTPAAVKVIYSDDPRKAAQFRQELKILSKYHHPHILLLMGACPDRGCLVYEFMPNGSLEDRLSRKDSTPPISWLDRFRIAFEVASALAFLHSSNPDPIVHRDLKPSNILLDSNLVSKIGDLGLATTLDSNHSDSERDPVGTMCYIDPEYQRTGQVSPESDVYALGVVVLQLLTAKPAIALVHAVETALAEGKLAKVLDEQAGDWPADETRELAEIGLGCTELRRSDRPDLRDCVLPALQRLKEAADKARDLGSDIDRLKSTPPPNHFICPILKDVMSDPCVASDGYTYDRNAIETWLETDKVSPVTNLAFSQKTLIPNYTLLSAIMEWKSREHR